jgi:hypothetical protein
MKVDHLISPPVPNKDYDGAMVIFDIVVNESWYALVELFPHAEGVLASFEVERREKKIKRILIDNHVAQVPGPTSLSQAFQDQDHSSPA